MTYNFDQQIERRGTDSAKWSRYGPDVLPLWVADMDFRSPEPVVEALRERVEHGVFGYGVEPARLRGVVQARLQRLFGWHVEPEDLIFLPGVVPGFNLVARALLERDDAVLIQTPAYPPFIRLGKDADRIIQTAPLVPGKTRYGIDFGIFEQAMTGRTRLFLLCNPQNPTGRVLTRSELEQLAEISLRHDLLVCSDEIHQDFVYPGHSHIPFATLGPEVAARTVALISPSKSFNIAGFHFAMAIASDPALRARLQATAAGLIPGRPGILDFVAGLAAYEKGQEWFAALLDYLRGNRDLVMGYVREELPGVSMLEPEGTYLAWLDCRGAGIEGPPGEFFLREARVGLNEGIDFGPEAASFVRLNLGCHRSMLEEALGRMRTALSRIPVRP